MHSEPCSLWVPGKVDFSRIPRGSSNHRFYNACAVRSIFCTFQTLQKPCNAWPNFCIVSHRKSKLLKVPQDSSSYRFYNTLGVCSIFCKSEVCTIYGKLCSLWEKSIFLRTTVDKFCFASNQPKTCRICYRHRKHYKTSGSSFFAQPLNIDFSRDPQNAKSLCIAHSLNLQNMLQTWRAL